MKSNISQLQQTIRNLRNAGNPNAMLQNMLQRNPNMKQAMDYVKQNGGNPKEAFYKLAKENGLNGDEIMGMLQ